MSRKLLATFLATIMIFSVVFFVAGYYYGYGLGPLRVGHLVADIHQIAFFVAYYKGFYEEEGFKTTRLEYTAGPAEMMAFAAGDLDAGYVGVVPALIARSKGGKEGDFVIVASANLEGSAIVAKPEISTLQDLNGKTVGTPGTGTIQDALLSMVENKLGIAVTHKPYAGSAPLPLAFEKGEIDAFIAWEPFAAEIVVKGLGYVIYTSHDILPDHQCCVLYVSGKMFREQKDLVKKLIGIHVRAMKFVSQQPSDAMKIFSDRTGKTMDIVQESWQRMIWNYHLNITSMKTFVNHLIQRGKILPGHVPNVDEFVNNAVDLQLLAEVEGAAS